MSTLMDHIAYLSQEIGPRPSGTEEEQQAALYITDRFQNEAQLAANIEDFSSNAKPYVVNASCYALTILCAVLACFVPVLCIPVIIVCVLSAAIYAAEAFDRPIVSRFFMTGVSQNVVAKYQPPQASDGSSSRRRKVILVANYDSGKVRRDVKGPLSLVQQPLQIATIAAMAAVPVLLLFRQLFFHDGAAGMTNMVLVLLAAFIVLIPLVILIINQAAPYNEAANNNASGVAVMLEVARRLGNGEVPADENPAPVIHDAAAAYEAGVVPDGASVSYDVAENLVQVGNAPLDEATPEKMSESQKSTKAALSVLPAGTLAEAAARAAVLHEEAEEAAKLEAAEALRKAEEEAQQAAQLVAESAPVVEQPKVSAVPDWYKKATAKARKNEKSEDIAHENAFRSRFADYPTGHEADEPAEEAAIVIEEIAGTEEAQPFVEEFVEAVESVDEENVAVEVAEGAVSASGDESLEKAEQADAHSTESASTTAVLEAVKPASFGLLDLDEADEEEADDFEEVEPIFEDDPDEPAAVEDAVEGATEVDAAVVAEDSSEDGVQAENADDAVDVVVSDSMPVGSEATDSAAQTTRLPQMMYYSAPEDRTEVQQERQLKDRVVVADASTEMAYALAEDVSKQVQETQQTPQSAAMLTTDASAMGLEKTQAFNPVEEQKEAVQGATQVMPVVAAAPTAAARMLSANIPVVDLPPIQLPSINVPEPKPITFEELKQRAPLANVADSRGQEAAKNLLATSLPSIEQPAESVDAGVTDFPADQQNSSVSLTGSFAAVSAIGAAPVGDELLENLDPEDIYVDDADDSVFDEGFTETGAFAGPGYVEMPQSRIGKFFSRFRRNKKEEDTPQDWLGVDEDFDARSVGKERGGWESFRDDDETWEGGAFSNLKTRLPLGGSNPQSGDQGHEDLPERSSRRAGSGDSVSLFDVPLKGNPEEEIQQIYSFAAGDVNTEVWFVALGSELGSNDGTKAFLAQHSGDMRGAIIVNLASLGGGELTYLEKEGKFTQKTCSARMKRFLRKASQASGVNVSPAQVNWLESPASYALKHNMQAVSIVGMDGNCPADFGAADDVIENIDQEALEQSADLVVELLKNI